MSKNLTITLLGLLLLALSISSCKKEVVDCTGVTYDATIKPIIDSKCSTTGCHGNGSTSGGLSTTSYSSMQTVLNNGDFTNRVLTLKDMPKNGSLSQNQLDLITCWKDNGFPEN